MRLFLSLLLAAAAPVAADTGQPYAGQQTREIASLSQADVAALLAGEGWGLALPAELNGYPGPAHVLEAADALGLTGAQRAETQAIFDAMKAEAQALGTQYVRVERHLTEAFRSGTIRPEALAHMTAMSGEVLARLRVAHLSAHLRMKEVLTAEQVAAYDRLRGYGSGGAVQGGHDHHHMQH